MEKHQAYGHKIGIVTASGSGIGRAGAILFRLLRERRSHRLI